MRYEELAPSVAFEPLISRFWAFGASESDPAQFDHVVMPDGACNLTVVQPFPGAALHLSLSGPSAVAMKVPIFRGALFRGVRIQPGALRTLLGLDVETMVDQSLALDTLLPELFKTSCARLNPWPESLAAFALVVEAVLADRADHASSLDQAVQQVVAQLIASDGDMPMTLLLKSSGLSERQMRRRFVAEVGLTPKVFSRLRRVRRACADLFRQQNFGVASISYDHGFADQAHFSREMRAMFGMSPQLLQQYLRQIEHTNVTELNDDSSNRHHDKTERN